jgi:hypothetical protein
VKSKKFSITEVANIEVGKTRKRRVRGLRTGVKAPEELAPTNKIITAPVLHTGN